MIILRSIGFVAVMGLIGLGGIEFVGRAAVPSFQGVIATAHAEVGRPLTPVSVAGVARRTARRCANGAYEC
jgi:hypothetical protein